MSDEWSDIPVDQGQDHLANYELLVTIREGGFAKVMVGRHLPTDTEVAVKVIEQQPDDTPLQEGTSRSSFRTTAALSEDQARPVFRQLISVVDHCHEKGIIHRDIKAENVLLDSHMTAKLSDFGLGTFYDGSPLSSVCGTPPYFAPELCMEEDYGPGVDVWALGVLLYVMLTDTFPFPGTSKREVEQQILGGQYCIPCYLSPEAIDLIPKLLTGIPEERENIRDFMGDPWVNLGEEKLKPYVEPPRGVTHLDPWVAGEMVNLGFSMDEIETVLATRAYSRVSATYHILLARAAKTCRYTTTPMEPFHPSQSRSPSPAQKSSKAESIPETSMIMAPSRAWPTLSPPSSPTSIWKAPFTAWTTTSPPHSPKSVFMAPSRAWRSCRGVLRATDCGRSDPGHETPELPALRPPSLSRLALAAPRSQAPLGAPGLSPALGFSPLGPSSPDTKAISTPTLVNLPGSSANTLSPSCAQASTTLPTPSTTSNS
ncbi:PREDICTED: serine/threonine-protein kinase MARK2-like [Hipposideros armiger]|uniref:non-specific serine/threonine protein kinase n=1 Tax=Hipposideros armiger TaxID=186990 RepID=A0A8B7PUV5_HIPAR|nr:PREDICTED: serine/threonine-protein kinase MARK2-like [Hipposideros armiger]